MDLSSNIITNWDRLVGSTTPFNWDTTATNINTNVNTYPTWERAEVGLSEHQKNEVITIANYEARRILKEFFEKITDENLKVDVDALQEYIDSFMKKAT